MLAPPPYALHSGGADNKWKRGKALVAMSGTHTWAQGLGPWAQLAIEYHPLIGALRSHSQFFLRSHSLFFCRVLIHGSVCVLINCLLRSHSFFAFSSTVLFAFSFTVLLAFLLTVLFAFSFTDHFPFGLWEGPRVAQGTGDPNFPGTQRPQH